MFSEDISSVFIPEQLIKTESIPLNASLAFTLIITSSSLKVLTCVVVAVGFSTFGAEVSTFILNSFSSDLFPTLSTAQIFNVFVVSLVSPLIVVLNVSSLFCFNEIIVSSSPSFILYKILLIPLPFSTNAPFIANIVSLNQISSKSEIIAFSSIFESANFNSGALLSTLKLYFHSDFCP